MSSRASNANLPSAPPAICIRPPDLNDVILDDFLLILTKVPYCLYDFLSTIDAAQLRASARITYFSCTYHPWRDRVTPIYEVRSWRSAFPRALSASLCLRDEYGGFRRDTGDIVDLDLRFIKGITDLNLTGRMTMTGDAMRLLGDHLLRLEVTLCRRICDKAFVGVPHLQHLTMQGCSQPAVSDSFSKGLQSLTFLDVSDCTQLTDVCFQPLGLLESLQISGCDQLTDAAFKPLARLHTLVMSGCMSVTDGAFIHLPRLRTLNASSCLQHTLTDRAFKHLSGLEVLSIRGCYQPTLTDAMFKHLLSLHTLNMTGCTQRTFTDSAFTSLRSLKSLTISDCMQFTNTCFERLPAGLTSLTISGCKQTTITDAGIQYLLTSRKNLTALNMGYCNQSTITDKAFEVAISPQIKELNISRCNQKEITTNALELLANVKFLKTTGLDHLWRELEAIKRERGAQHLRDKIFGLKENPPDIPSEYASGADAAAAKPESETVPLKSLTYEEVGNVFCNISGMECAGSTLRNTKITGHMLHIVDHLDEIKSCGVPGIRSKVVMGKVKLWREEGVKKFLLVPKVEPAPEAPK